MQTFLPYPDFTESAQCLDPRRLGKQRLEAVFVLQRLRGVTQGKGWANHPIMRMWRGHENTLARYGLAMSHEWRRRGYVDNLAPRFKQLVEPAERFRRPPWLGVEAFHASHRSNLLRKEPAWYGQMGWREGPELPYLWPTPLGGTWPSSRATTRTRRLCGGSSPEGMGVVTIATGTS